MSKVYHKKVGNDIYRIIHHEDDVKTIIPPLTTSIDHSFSKKKSYNCSKKIKHNMTENEIQNFSWRKNSKNINITTPFNQETCGSCWAVAVSTALNDHISISANKLDKRVNFNPNLGPTYILSNYMQEGCGGGSPMIALNEIDDYGGIMSEHCIDYSWLYSLKQNNSNKKGGKEFDTDDNILNQHIPLKNSCYVSTDNKVIYNGLEWNGEVYDANHSISYDQEIECDILNIKSHIYNQGPIITTFKVYSDFMYGLPDDYDNYDWDKDGIYIRNLNESNKQVGGHAVVVIGWGEKKVDVNTGYSKKFFNKHKDRLSLGEYNEVTMRYWECRNSWGSNWGNNGYFRVPISDNKNLYNKDIGFDCITQDEDGLGGFILFKYNFGNEYCLNDSKFKSIKPGDLELKNDEKYYMTDELNCKKMNENGFFESTKKSGSNNGIIKFKEYIEKIFSNHKNKIYIGVFILLVLIVILLIVLVVKK